MPGSLLRNIYRPRNYCQIEDIILNLIRKPAPVYAGGRLFRVMSLLKL